MKNPDVLDQAAEVTAFMAEKQIELVRQQTQPEIHPDFDGKHCVGIDEGAEDCGVEIPDERLALGKVRCVDCQNRIEKSRRGPGVIW